MVCFLPTSLDMDTHLAAIPPMPPNQRPSMPTRRGFTLTEMLIVIIIVGIITAVALPKLDSARTKAALRSAKQELAAYLATTRAAAIRRSQPAQFYTASNKIWATVAQPDGTRASLTGSVYLDRSLNVTITIGTAVGATDSIIFDPRGMATLTSSKKFVLTRNSTKDSLCVSRLGLIALTCAG